MKNVKSLLVILVISVCLSFVGFFVDNDPNPHSLSFNLYEISMVSLLLFLLITAGYFMFKGIFKLAKY